MFRKISKIYEKDRKMIDPWAVINPKITVPYIEYKNNLELAYFEGQKDYCESIICVVKNDKGEYIWIKSPYAVK